MITPRAHPDSGFTLVEVLVAMTLLGLVMVLLFGGLRFGLHAWERTAEHTAESDEIRLAQSFLRREVGQAYPGIDSTDEMHPHVAFVGTPTALDVVAPTLSSLGAGARARLQLAGVRRDGLIDFVARARGELATGETGITETLLSNVAAVEFGYFGVIKPGEDAAWHAEWSGTMRLPKLIRIRVKFPEGDNRLWPEMIVAPAVSADIACVIDPFTHDCRGR